jgi:hypothetical protein
VDEESNESRAGGRQRCQCGARCGDVGTAARIIHEGLLHTILYETFFATVLSEALGRIEVSRGHGAKIIALRRIH